MSKKEWMTTFEPRLQKMYLVKIKINTFLPKQNVLEKQLYIFFLTNRG